MKPRTQAAQAAMTPSMALDLLKAGNERFIADLNIRQDLLQQMRDTSNGQHPFAVILSCIDSRTSVELIFDQGIGDVFSVRIAGSVVNQDVLGSLEFSCKLAGSKLIVVLGHTQCGAVKGACDYVEMGHLTPLLKKIQHAVTDEQAVFENRTSSNPVFVENVTDIHIKKSLEAIMEGSPILKEMIDAGACGLVGAKHDITTGKVYFNTDSMLGFFNQKAAPHGEARVSVPVPDACVSSTKQVAYS